jgi:hypothetical protein
MPISKNRSYLCTYDLYGPVCNRVADPDPDSIGSVDPDPDPEGQK